MPGTVNRKKQGQEHRERMRQRTREMVRSVSDIGALPKVKNPRRKAACRYDLLKFLVTYFPESTGSSPFSDDHHRVIARVQHSIVQGGRFVNAVYRGFAKTTIAENSLIWGILYGHRQCGVLFGGDSGSAEGSLDSIKTELAENDLLYDDFPEACHAIRALEGKPQRCNGQLYKNRRTHIEWSSERVVLPFIGRREPDRWAAIYTRGIVGGFRGLKKKLTNGVQLRPDVVIGDDLQTDESAATAGQVAKTLRILRKGIAKMGGHRAGLAMVINATVIEPDDAIEQLLADRAWQGERIPMVRQWPNAHETFWLEDYARVRKGYDPGVVGDQARARAEATDLYRSRRAEADAGGSVSWESCFEPDKEISAIQHAYNMLIDDGEEAFASECQQQPTKRRGPDDVEGITADLICNQLNRIGRGKVPLGATRLTIGVDVQHRLLYYVACAWEDDFTGYVVDYGTWPDQRRAYFTYSDSKVSLSQALAERARKAGIPVPQSVEACVYAGLEALSGELLGRDWFREDGAVLRPSRLLVDANEGTLADVIYQFCRQTRYLQQVMPILGRAATAGRDSYRDYKKKPGERQGMNWLIPTVRGTRATRHVQLDPNFWKTFVHSRLGTAMGGRGCLSLFGTEPSLHRMFADQVTAEVATRTRHEGSGRQYVEWSNPSRQDNHFLDALVYAAVGGSIEGAALPETQPARQQRPERDGPKRKLSELQAEKMGR